MRRPDDGPEPVRLDAIRWYRCVDTPANLIRMGLCRPDPSTRTGITPCGTVLRNGLVSIRYRPSLAIWHDERFQQALERCVNGEPCVDFALPTVKRKRRSGGSEAGEPA